MIVTRFRSVGWVVAGTTAMLACYLVTQHVAGERAQLAQVEHNLLTAKRDVRRLQTEIETRARAGQLERWNEEVLALSAPKPSQYVSGEVQLASFNAPAQPAPLANDGAPAEVAQVKYDASAAPAPKLVPATYVTPAGGAMKAQRIAMLDDGGDDFHGKSDKKTVN